MAEQVRLLVIDDSEDDRLLYKRVLTKTPDAQYVIEEADDGERGIALLDANAPDCVLLDYSLPGRNGLDILKKIRLKHPFAPVLMLTGQGNETVAVMAMQLGAQNYISKSSISPEHLHRAIQIAIAHCTMQQRLHEQRLSLEIFTRALAHDLNEPVRTIRSFLSIVSKSELLSDQGRQHFEFIQKAADRMGHLINAVYDYTRLDMSAEQDGLEMCDCNVLLAEAQADLGELIADQRTIISASPLPLVAANASRLRQVFQNLLSNAIRHCPPGTVIDVSAKEQGPGHVFTIADTGPGVEPALRDKIFDPFSRHSRHGPKGLGMGLAICKRIVESRGGKIWCEPSAAGGAAFVFTLPRDARPSETIAGAAQTELRPSAEKVGNGDLATILVVDDDEASIELTRIMLLESSSLHCQLISASTGEEALHHIRSSQRDGASIDLMLLDINMPLMDGFQVLEELRKLESAAPPVLMCSTSRYDKDVARARMLGASGYLDKPPNLQTLMPYLGALPHLLLSSDESGYTLRRVA